MNKNIYFASPQVTSGWKFWGCPFSKMFLFPPILLCFSHLADFNIFHKQHGNIEWSEAPIWASDSIVTLLFKLLLMHRMVAT